MDDLGTVQHVEAYVRRTVLNLYLDGYRRRRRWGAVRHLVGRQDATDGPDQGSPERLDVDSALAALPPRQRACVVLRYFSDLTVAQIADDLGVTTGTVKRHLHDAVVVLERSSPGLPRSPRCCWSSSSCGAWCCRSRPSCRRSRPPTHHRTPGRASSRRGTGRSACRWSRRTCSLASRWRAGPDDIELDPVRRAVWVSCYEDGTVSVIDAAAHVVVATIAVGTDPSGLGMDPEAGLVYVAGSGPDGVGIVSVIDARTLQVVGTVPLGPGARPGEVAVDPVTHAVFVPTSRSDVTVIDTDTRRVVATVPVGENPIGMAVDADRGRALVMHHDDGVVASP